MIISVSVPVPPKGEDTVFHKKVLSRPAEDLKQQDVGTRSAYCGTHWFSCQQDFVSHKNHFPVTNLYTPYTARAIPIVKLM